MSDRPGFRRRNGPTDDVFERASWQFYGSLDNALAELVDGSA